MGGSIFVWNSAYFGGVRSRRGVGSMIFVPCDAFYGTTTEILIQIKVMRF